MIVNALGCESTRRKSSKSGYQQAEERAGRRTREIGFGHGAEWTKQWEGITSQGWWGQVGLKIEGLLYCFLS